MENAYFTEKLKKYLDDKDLIKIYRLNKKYKINLKIDHLKDYYEWGKIQKNIIEKYKINNFIVNSKNELKEIINNENCITIEKIKFSYHFNKKIKKWPAKINEIIFGASYNKALLYEKLPITLKSLVFGYNYNEPFLWDEKSSIKLKSLTFGGSFDQAIKKLPPSLEYLSFGNNFNRSISKENLPPNLKKIKFGRCFNKSINKLPDSIESIEFDSNIYNEYGYKTKIKDFFNQIILIWRYMKLDISL